MHLLFTLYFRFEGTSYKNMYNNPSYNISYCFMLAFTSEDIIFHKFLELHSTLSEKKIFVTHFSFFTDSMNKIFATINIFEK